MSTAVPHATLYAGLDLHKRSVFALTVDATGEEVAREKLPARADSLALYFADLPAQEHCAVAEATWRLERGPGKRGYVATVRTLGEQRRRRPS